MPTEIARIGILLILIIVGFIYFKFGSRRSLILKTLGIENIEIGIPAILYFTTPFCQVCKTVQKPELNKLKERLTNGIQIIEINALEEILMADYWGVLSVPTTFVIDAEGRPRKINFGVASSEKLFNQVKKIISAKIQ